MEGLVHESRVTELLQRSTTDRAILYFAFGLSDNSHFFNSDWCFELNLLSATVDARHFALIDRNRNDAVRYRALFMLDSIRNYFSNGEDRTAFLRGGSSFNLFRNVDSDSAMGCVLSHSLFHLRAEEVLSIAEGRDLEDYFDFYRMLSRYYVQRQAIVDAMEHLCESGLWFVLRETCTNGEQPIVVSFMMRHVADSDPEIIIAIEHTVFELPNEYNCDSYVDSEESDLCGNTGAVEIVAAAKAMLRVVWEGSNEDVEYELTSSTWAAVLEGFALMFPHYTVTKDVQSSKYGALEVLPEGCDEAVQDYVEECATAAIPLVFVHKLRPGEVTSVVGHTQPTNILRRPQHHVAMAMFNKICERLEKDGQSIDQYTSLQFKILVPKFNTLKQQTIERIEACAELVRDGEDSSSLVEMYPLVGNGVKNMEAFENKIRDESNSKVLFVLIVDECHHSPTETAISILHRSDMRSHFKNFVVLMVSATPYNCLSDKSRVPEGNIIEWSQNINKSDRPNYIGFEHYFRSVAFRLPSWELLLCVDTVVVPVSLPLFQEFANFETLARVITSKLKDCALLFGTELRCIYVSSRFKFTFKRQGRAPKVFITLNPFLSSLGFTQNITFADKGVAASEATNAHTVDDGTSVTSQHMREDTSFSALYNTILNACPALERYNGKKRAQGGSLCKDDNRSDALLKNAMMADKNGFTIIVDYIFSLAYFGSCRVVQKADGSSPCTLRVLSANEAKVTDEMCNEFLRMINCFCCLDDSNFSCAIKTALAFLCSTAKKEINLRGPANPIISYNESIRHILESKLDGERHHQNTSESESWFTETDRIVWMLLVERKPAPMVLMRVFDKDENRSMQIILRHAMRVCGLVRERASRCDVPAFSVITDTSDTSLLKEIEPYYRDEYDVGEGGTVMDFARRRQAQSDLGTAKTNSLDLKYEDLLNVPCLIILCEKGRMGDTFPHTLRALDLRLRTSGSAQVFLQEIGRMCRYPSTECGTVVSAEGLEAFFLQNNAKFGWTVSIPDSNAFLGIAKKAEDVRRILRVQGDDAPSYVQLAYLVHPLPYALIDPEVMQKIRNAIDMRETEVFTSSLSESEGELARADKRIINYLRMRRGVDDYVSCQTMKTAHSYKLAKSKGHYDLGNIAKDRHDRRFLLSAECQVGKTGAYLHLLTMLRHAIKENCDHSLLPIAPTIPIGSLWCKWLIPSETNLQGQEAMQYDFPKTGKYHDSIARQRIAQLKTLLDDSHDPRPLYERFINSIQEYERVSTKKGLRLLSNLSNISVCSDIDYRKFVNWDNRFQRDGRWHPSLQEEPFVGAWLGERLINGVPLAQDIMFGAGISGRSAGDVDDNVDGEIPSTAPFGTTFTPISDVSQSNAFDSAAKSLARTPCIVPINDSVVANLDNFFGNVTTLPHHRFGPDPLEMTGTIKLSIPRAAFRKEIRDYSVNIDSGAELKAMLFEPQRIRSWIFTPSYCGTAVGPEEKLLLRENAFSVDGKPLTRWTDYGEVLIVRANQLEMFQQFYGGTHIIAALPETMQFVDVDGYESVMEAAKHGCGYSRRFSQLLAQYMGWNSIWMIDDYVLKCWKLVCRELLCSSNNVSLEPASFAEVMLHIESMFFGNPSASTYPNLEGQVTKMIASEFDPCVASSSRMRGLADVTGAMQDKYGVIGMCRGRQWRSNIAHPIKRSYSVYSFFLLNVKATAGNGLYFPARPIWEDIEFNNLLDENNLLVCKLQVFAHDKLSHAAAEPAPPKASDVSDHAKLVMWLDSEGFVVSNLRKESLMQFPRENVFLTTLNDFLELNTPIPLEPQQPCYVSLVHNPNVFQRGAFGGIARSTCTLQSCVDTIVNDSMMLEQALTSVAVGDADTATWLMILPHMNNLTDALLRDNIDLQRCLRVSYVRLIPPRELYGDMGDAFFFLFAKVQRYTEGVEDPSIDPIVRSAQEMHIGTEYHSLEDSAPSSSNVLKEPLSSAKRKRNSLAKPSPRKRNATMTLQDQYILDHGLGLLQEFERKCEAQGATNKPRKRGPIRNEIFKEHVTKFNELGDLKLNELKLYNVCSKHFPAEANKQLSGLPDSETVGNESAGELEREDQAEVGGADSVSGNEADMYPLLDNTVPAQNVLSDELNRYYERYQMDEDHLEERLCTSIDSFSARVPSGDLLDENVQVRDLRSTNQSQMVVNADGQRVEHLSNSVSPRAGTGVNALPAPAPAFAPAPAPAPYICIIIDDDEPEDGEIR